jgi:hypothetical protein
MVPTDLASLYCRDASRTDAQPTAGCIRHPDHMLLPCTNSLHPRIQRPWSAPRDELEDVAALGVVAVQEQPQRPHERRLGRKVRPRVVRQRPDHREAELRAARHHDLQSKVRDSKHTWLSVDIYKTRNQPEFACKSRTPSSQRFRAPRTLDMLQSLIALQSPATDDCPSACPACVCMRALLWAVNAAGPECLQNAHATQFQTRITVLWHTQDWQAAYIHRPTLAKGCLIRCCTAAAAPA